MVPLFSDIVINLFQNKHSANLEYTYVQSQDIKFIRWSLLLLVIKVMEFY